MNEMRHAKQLVMTMALMLCPLTVIAKSAVQSVITDHERQAIKLRLSEKASYHYFHLNNPPRFVLDLEQTSWSKSWYKRAIKLKCVKAMRAGYGADHRLRLVFDLRQPGVKGSIVPAKGPANKLTIHFSTKRRHHGIAQQISQQNRREIRVVIDPGHGGKDPGANGPYGYQEKDVVLKIAKDLQQRINMKKGFEATLTRGHDRYVPLRTRLHIARQKKADLFVAIHADAYKNRDAHGASVYALSKRGATSEAARWLARHENQSELAGVDVSDRGRILKSILLDLSQTATLGSSLRVGYAVLHQLQRVTDLHHGKVEQAAFVVLKAPDTPSLLVESGFISNPEEERRLRSPLYRGKLAQALTKGIVHFFYKHPPADSFIKLLKKQTQQYTVKGGDNLSAIAQRFQTSIAHVKRLNELSTTQLTVGQTLKVPVIVTNHES